MEEDSGAPLNRSLLEAYVRAFREAAAVYQIPGHPDLNAALRLPGMLASAAVEGLGEHVSRALLETAEEAAALLHAFREREGGVIAQDLHERCRVVCTLADRMQEIRPGAVPAFHKRLREKLAELLNGAAIEPQRLAQEAAFLADRSDISEE